MLSKAPPNDRCNSAAALVGLAERAGKFYRRSSEDWLACGNLLLEAKKVCPHGEWSVFLEEAGIPQRSARRMLAFAMAGVQNGHVAVLGVRYIDRLIAASRRTTAGAIDLARVACPRLVVQRLRAPLKILLFRAASI